MQQPAVVSSHTISNSLSNTDKAISKQSQLFSAAILGFLIVCGVGLAPMDVVHNAAHDARHSFAFPCH